MGTLLSAASLLACTAFGQVVPRDAFNRHGFEPYWDLASKPEFRCVGYFEGTKASGVWLGGPYVLFVSHGTGTHGRGQYLPVDPKVRVFVLPHEGRKHRFVGAKWHIPRVTWILDAGTEDENAKLWTTMQTAMDVAVLELESTPRITGIEPARLYEGNSEVGMESVWVGYGIRGTDDIGTDEQKHGWGGGDNPPRRFGFRNRIDYLNRWGYMLNATFDREGLPLEGHQSAGSSGGGVFAQVEGKWVLIGGAANGRGSMNDRLSSTGSAFGSVSGATRISKWRKELVQGLNGDWSAFTGISSRTFNGKRLRDQ